LSCQPYSKVISGQAGPLKENLLAWLERGFYKVDATLIAQPCQNTKENLKQWLQPGKNHPLIQ